MTTLTNGGPSSGGAPFIGDLAGQPIKPKSIDTVRHLRAIDRVTDALREQDCRPRGPGTTGNWSARCPAHDDRHPSLSFREFPGADGTNYVVLNCHAGCPNEAIVDALGLHMADLYDNRKGAAHRYDNGRLVGRMPGRRFTQANTDAPPELYRLSEVKTAVAEGRTVYVVEGEKDADALCSLGYAATTNPMGAGNWAQVDPTPLAGATVVVVADDDKKGMAHAADVDTSLRRLHPPATVTVVKAAKGKDAADHVLAGHGVENFIPVDLVAATTTRLKVITASQVQERRVAYVWDGRIPIGSPTLMPGEEGIGKTTVGVRMMADLTRGALRGEFYGEPRDVVVMAPEDGIEDVVKPRFREAGADLDRVHFVVSRQEGEDEDSVILPRDLPLLTDVVRRVDAAMVWIDSLVTVLPDELKSISYKDVNKAMKAIGSWADVERVAVIAPWHLNESAGSDTALRMMDSRAFRTAVRSLLLIVADPDAEEGGPQRGIVALDKANAGTLNLDPPRRYFTLLTESMILVAG
jgi:archaellum biogenesis ATPase FlaH